MRVREDTYPLAIEVIRVATGAQLLRVKEAGGGIEAVRVPVTRYKNRSQWTDMVTLE